MTAWETAVRSMVGSRGLGLREELYDLGVTPQTLRRRLDRGLLVEVNRKVVALPGTTLDLRRGRALR